MAGLLCPACGRENPEGFAFCGFCTASLSLGAEPQVEERKLVTVLFCDLVGFTQASEAADPEDVRARLHPYHSMLRREIEGYGGTVEKFIGDAVMAVFGAPIAHEDDPERAVRAALRILEAIDDLNDQDPMLELSVRIGVNSGEVLVALGARPEQGEGIVTGDVVNTASRLQGVAPVGGVVVGEATYRATGREFEYLRLEPIGVKGKSDPVPIWQAVASRARFGTDLGRALTTPLVGRELERTLLTGTLERSMRDRSVHLLTIVGEPGVGKSRLVAELSRFVDERPELIRWRQGRCLPYGDGVSFWALGEIVKAEAGILETDPPENAAVKIDALIDDEDPDAPWLRQRLRPLVGLDAPEAGREENFVAWRRFLESLAERDPSVFVLEDLHWADEALLGFLEHVAEYADGVPLVLLGTARPELYERSPTWAATARNANRINLAPLTENETAQLIGNLLEQAVLPAEVQAAILHRSGGNPLYAEEFVRLLKDQGILTKEGATWRLDPDVEIPTPSGIQGLIAARLDTLPADRKHMLQDAAVVGKVFWSGTVAAMSDREPKEVEAAMHELSRKELVRSARRSSMEGQAEYAFFHALVRDVCYAQIPRTQRSERHRRAAGWIEDIAGERLEDHAEILASHYGTALELASRTKDPNVDELAEKAIKYFTLAGDRAVRIDVKAAEKNYAKALELTPEAHPERPRILAHHGEALLQRARYRDAASAFEQAIEGLRERDDLRAIALAMGGYSRVLHSLGDPRYRQVAVEAVALLDPLGPSPDLAESLGDLARAAYVGADYREAISSAEQAIVMAEGLGLPEPAQALGYRGGARCCLGDAGGLDDIRRALTVASAQGLGREVPTLLGNLGELLWAVEGPRPGLDSLSEGAAFAERRGMTDDVFFSAASSLDMQVALGSWDDALSIAEDLAPRLEDAGYVQALVVLRCNQVMILCRRGQLSRVGPLAEMIVRTARDTGDLQVTAGALPIAALARLGSDDASGARALLSELEQTPDIRGELYYWAFLPDAVRSAVSAGDPVLASKLADGAHPAYPLYEHAHATARALLEEERGDYGSAAEAFADVSEGWEQFETPWEQAQALLGQARCLLALGKAHDASAAVRKAREIFSSLGARPALVEADSLLARTAAVGS